MKITIELTDEQIKEIVSQTLLANLGDTNTPKKAKKPANRVTGGPSSAEVREWAKNQGMEVNSKGLVKDDIKIKFLEAHQ